VAKFTFLTLALLLVACGTTVFVDSIERADISRTAASQPVVLGRLHIRSASGISIMPEHPRWSNESPKRVAYIALVRLHDGSTYLAQVHANGRFAWSLYPGTYVIERVRGVSLPLEFNYAFCPKTIFRVERRTGIVNLGEIVIEFPTDPTQSSLTPGLFDRNLCEVPENQINVTQEAGEITRLVLHPLTRVVVAPQLPELWAHREEDYVSHNNLPKARAVLRKLGITISR
jgi:hypothetical protein